jgi:hypothetical protein
MEPFVIYAVFILTSFMAAILVEWKKYSAAVFFSLLSIFFALQAVALLIIHHL